MKFLGKRQEWVLTDNRQFCILFINEVSGSEKECGRKYLWYAGCCQALP